MNDVDRVSQWRQLSEHYRRLTDEELIDLAKDPSELTDVAQQALMSEVTTRKLKVPPEPEEKPAPRPIPETDPDSPYARDREFVEFATVFSPRDAQQLQSLLASSTAPILWGANQAATPEEASGNFSEGMSVRTMRVAIPWLRSTLAQFEPQDDPRPVEPENTEPVPVLCPECGSDQVFLDHTEQDPENPAKDQASTFAWECDACGHRWEDDGVTERAN
jgi:hypothetical protein